MMQCLFVFFLCKNVVCACVTWIVGIICNDVTKCYVQLYIQFPAIPGNWLTNVLLGCIQILASQHIYG